VIIVPCGVNSSLRSTNGDTDINGLLRTLTDSSGDSRQSAHLLFMLHHAQSSCKLGEDGFLFFDNLPNFVKPKQELINKHFC